MFFFFALFAVSFLLTAFLSPKMKVENAKADGLDKFTFPRSNEGDAVTRFYGMAKLLSPNTISISGYRAVPIKKKVKTGIFSSKTIITGYKYYLTVDLAWALGPDVIYRRMWFGDHLVWSGCFYTADCYNEIPINLPEIYGGSEDGKRGGIAGTVAFYCGSFEQDRDPYLVANLDEDVPAYIGIAHTVFRDFWWGNQSSIDVVTVEAGYYPRMLGGVSMMPNGLDANGVCVLYDILTDTWGNLGYDPTKLNTAQWAEAATFIYNEDAGLNGVTMTVSSASEAKEAIKQILRQLKAVLVEDQSTGLVDIKFLRNDYDPDDLPVLNASNVSEIRNYTKKLWNETFNIVRVKYTDRADNYAQGKLAQAKDTSLLRYQGKPRPIEITMPGVYVAENANAIAARELANLNVPLFSCELVLNRKFSTTLKPGEAFKLVWPEYGITSMIMRVKKMNLGTLEDGKITLQVVQDEFAVDSTVLAPPAPSGYIPTTYAPTDISDIVYLELPAWLDYKAGLGTPVGSSRFAALAAAPSSYSIGYSAYIDLPGDDARVLSVAPYVNTAELVSALDRFAGFTTGIVASLVVKNISDPDALAPLGTPRVGGGLMLIGTELLAYESAVDNMDDTWTLEDVHRAFFDTGWQAHAADERVWFIVGQEAFYESDTPNGDEIDTYLLDKTPTATSSPDTATVATLEALGRVERVIAPDYVTANGIRTPWQEFNDGDTVTINARPRSRLDVGDAWYEDDAASTAEAGTTYKITYEVVGVETLVEDDVALPYDLAVTTAMSGATVIHVYAKRDGVYSIASAPLPIIVGDVLTIDGDPVLIDGEGIVF